MINYTCLLTINTIGYDAFLWHYSLLCFPLMVLCLIQCLSAPSLCVRLALALCGMHKSTIRSLALNQPKNADSSVEFTVSLGEPRCSLTSVCGMFLTCSLLVSFHSTVDEDVDTMNVSRCVHIENNNMQKTSI